MGVRAVSVFSGAGLMDLGFDAEGIDILEHCEWNRAAVSTLRRNWPHDVKICNADKYVPKIKNLDLLFGGPPCQPFSKGGLQRGALDPKDRFFLAHTWAEKARPRLIVFETVANVFAEKFDDWRDWWWEIMASHGYEGVMWQLNAADYGTPQLRERVFFVAWRRGEKRLAKILDEPPPVTHVHPDLVEETGLPVWTTALERLIGGCCGRFGRYSCWALNNGGGFCETCVDGDNYQMAANEEEPDEDLTEKQIKYLLRRADRVTVKHVPTDMSGLQPPRPRRWLLGETVPKNLRRGVPYGLVIHQDAQFKDVHQLLEDQKEFGLPGVRFLTVREAAKLQDCPQWYIFEGSPGQQRAQVGNAVPVNVARAVARQIMRGFGQRTPKLALVRQPHAGLWPVGGANVACQIAYGKLKAYEGTPFGQMEFGLGRRR
jgi:DNA-cytosine methyltransferase